MSTQTDPPARRALALAALTSACLLAALGLATDQASANYTAGVQAGTSRSPATGRATRSCGDLTGTGLTTANVDLAAFDGTGDGAADTVSLNGGDKAEHVRVTRAGSQVLTTGLAAQTAITGSEAALDVLHVNTLGGRDDVQVVPDVSTLITPVVDLGADQ